MSEDGSPNVDFDALPALVPKGSDESTRKQIIGQIVAGWAKPISEDDAVSVLSGVRLWDDDRGEPIDLGFLLRELIAVVDGARSSSDSVSPGGGKGKCPSLYRRALLFTASGRLPQGLVSAVHPPRGVRCRC